MISLIDSRLLSCAVLALGVLIASVKGQDHAKSHYIRVRVLDTDGKPARAVPLRVGPTGDWQISPRSSATSRKGIGSVRVPQMPRNPFFITVGVESLLPVRRRIEPAEVLALREPIELRLPPTGTLELIVVDTAGNTRTDVSRVSMSLPDGRFPGRGPTERRRTGGLFRYVGVGVPQVRFSLEFSGIHGGVSALASGPKRPGEVAAVRVVTKHLIEAQLELADGEPFAGRRVFVRLIRDEPPRPKGIFPVSGIGPPALPEFEQKTDKRGVVRFFLPPELFREGEKATFLVTTWPNRGSFDAAPRLFGRKRIRGRAPELSKVTMTAVPIAIAGVVVDDSGAPVPRAVVQTSSGAQMITDEKGRFSLRGTPEQQPTRIGVQVSGYLRHSQTVAFGDQQAKVVLTRAARFAGSFQQTAPVKHVRLELVDAKGQNPRDAFFSFDGIKIEGDFIPAGRYTVRVWVHLRKVHEIRGVDMVAGQICRDPRLQDAAWSRFLVNRKIRVVDGDGQPLVGARVQHWRFLEDTSLRGTKGETDASGEVSLWMPPGEPHLLIETADGRCQRFDDVTADRTRDRPVVIGPRRRLRVEIDRAPTLPDDVRLEAWWLFRPRWERGGWNLQAFDFRTIRGSVPMEGARCELPLPGEIPLVAEIRVRRIVNGKRGVTTEVVEGLGGAISPGAKALRIEWKEGDAALADAIRRLHAR